MILPMKYNTINQNREKEIFVKLHSVEFFSIVSSTLHFPYFSSVVACFHRFALAPLVLFHKYRYEYWQSYINFLGRIF